MKSEMDYIPQADVAKRLFTPSPQKVVKKRDPLRRSIKWSTQVQNTFTIGILGALIFLILCAGAVVITAKLNNAWTTITLEEVHRFFSNELLHDHGSQSGGYFYFNGRHLLGFLGALPLAVALGTACGAFTCLFMFYDSDEPGSFPPTPVSPPRHSRGLTAYTEWHLGYLFVPINILVSFSLALFYFRWNMGLPMV